MGDQRLKSNTTRPSNTHNTNYKHEGNRSHSGRTVRQPDRRQILGGDLTSTESTPPEHTTETPISSWRESMSTTMRPLVANMCPVPSLWILSPEPWTPSDLVHSDRSSDPTTLCSDRAEPETTGPRDITPRVLSS